VLDPTTASRAELLALIGAQQALIAELRATNAELRAANAQAEARVRELEGRVRELEAKLDKGGPRGFPGHKAEAPPEPERPRKRRARGYGRRRMRPTRRVVHAAERCPGCGAALRGGSVKRTREVIDVPLGAAEVVEHALVERRCPGCGRRVVPPLDLGGVVVGRQRLGTGLLSLIVTLREEARLPVAAIRRYLATVHRLELSRGAIVAAGRQVAERGRPEVDRIRARVRASPVVHADETGWRQDGRNGYAWAFSTPTERYFAWGGRDKGMLDAVLGDAFAGVLVSDFYAAYDHVRGGKQRCWSHLLRDIHELRERHPADARLQAWADALHRIYDDATAFVAAGPDAPARRRAAEQFEARLLGLCRPLLADAAAPQRALCARITKYVAELLTFVREPGVPPDNNAAERSLRHLVTSRKISGGTRSDRGTATKMALSTLFGTWHAQDLNPLLACQQLLSSPQV
jgi:transposase